MLNRLLPAFTFSVISLLSPLVWAAPGDLDITFNSTGKVTTAIGAASDRAQSVIQQSDGKLVVAGYSYNAGQADFALVRYNTNGTLDTAFSGDGKVTTAIGADDDFATSVIQQSDGKLVVAGYISVFGNYDIALVRYNADGSLDTSFSGDGKVTTGIGAADDFASSVIQQSDGKLVVAGYSTVAGNYDFAVVRYNTNGLLDTSFNGNGIVITAVGAAEDTARSVIQQSDGKLVVAGYSYITSSNDFAVVRYNANGSLDTGFNSTGKLTTAIGFGNDEAASVIQQSDGRLVLAGYSYIITGYYDFALVRYNANGSLDTSFSGDGKLTSAVSVTDDFAYSVIQQSDGKLVAAGVGNNAGNNDFALARYTTSGTLDTSFNSDGIVTTAISNGTDIAYSIIQQRDGRLVAAGYSVNSGNDDFSIVRYLSGQIISQTITVTTAAPASALFNTTFPVAATASSGLTVAITATGGCTIAGGTVTMTSGTTACTVNYNQAGNTYFGAAPQVQSITTAIPDTDSDGIADSSDNCPSVANTNQLNMDADAFGDACDGDIDGDGVANGIDANPLSAANATELIFPLDGTHKGANMSGGLQVQ